MTSMLVPKLGYKSVQICCNDPEDRVLLLIELRAGCVITLSRNCPYSASTVAEMKGDRYLRREPNGSLFSFPDLLEKFGEMQGQLVLAGDWILF